MATCNSNNVTMHLAAVAFKTHSPFVPSSFLHSLHVVQGQHHTIRMAHIPHALGLPEVAFRVAQYLELGDFVTCSLVSKSFYDSFAPYLWENIHLGVFSLPEIRIEHYQEPQARFIALKPALADNILQEQHPSQHRGIVQFLQKIAPWIRSLSMYPGYFGRQMMLSNQCTSIQSLLISTPSFKMPFEEEDWNACEAMVQGSKNCLRSLTLIGWSKLFGDPLLPIWSPLHTCAQHANLNTLRIRRSELCVGELESFWTICRQLEILELTEIDMTVLSSESSRRAMDTIGTTLLGKTEMEPTLGIIPPLSATITSTSTATTTTSTTIAAVRFPKLRELTLDRIELNPSYQIKFILQCPMLHTLVWRLREYRFSLGEFCDYFAAQAWPHLDSLGITGFSSVLSTQEYALLLQSTQRRFKRLDLKHRVKDQEQESFDLLRKGGHFETLTKVDLRVAARLRHHLPSFSGINVTGSKRIREVLESCPSLEYFAATAISGQDIIDSQPWVCHRLKTFEVLICMEITKQQIAWAVTEYTEDDKRQCHQVFERLSQLGQLKVLNTSNSNLEGLYPRGLATLPLDLRMGLGHLSTLKDLEWIEYHGLQRMRMVDVEWMLQHWTRLRVIRGERPTMKLSKTFGHTNVRCYLIKKALKARKVDAPGDWRIYDEDVIEYMKNNGLDAVYDTDDDS
ncbi:hypothetical protein B0O80DRAFT_491687 [Mortierella sp. GBAus27b]|nr:hypothetical protein B0O80DRAFT_491687 [Mortierella sp. GBAus27b]